jgi:hypothetical protein
MEAKHMAQAFKLNKNDLRVTEVGMHNQCCELCGTTGTHEIPLFKLTSKGIPRTMFIHQRCMNKAFNDAKILQAVVAWKTLPLSLSESSVEK